MHQNQKIFRDFSIFCKNNRRFQLFCLKIRFRIFLCKLQQNYVNYPKFLSSSGEIIVEYDEYPEIWIFRPHFFAPAQSIIIHLFTVVKIYYQLSAMTHEYAHAAAEKLAARPRECTVCMRIYTFQRVIPSFSKCIHIHARVNIQQTIYYRTSRI